MSGRLLRVSGHPISAEIKFRFADKQKTLTFGAWSRLKTFTGSIKYEAQENYSILATFQSETT